MAAALRIGEFAARDIAHQWRRFGAAILAVASAVAPLLMLLGLKDGVVGALRAELESDPVNLEIRYKGQAVFDADWIEALRALPETGFVIPKNARFLNSSVRLRNRADRSRDNLDVTLEPTGAGDPVLGEEAAKASGTAVILSVPALELLGLSVGDAVQAIVERDRAADGIGMHRIELAVAGVVPLQREGRLVAFVDPALTRAVQGFRETGDFDLARAAADVPATYPSFRLYARDIDAVEPLRDRLVAERRSVETNAGAIAWVKLLSGALDSLFTILATVLALGGILGVSAAISANVLSQERELALLRVAGYDAKALALFPVAQGIAVVCLGGLVALAVYRLCAPMLDNLLRARLELTGASVLFDARRLGVFALALALGGAVASLGAARYVLSMDTIRRLRDA